MGTLDDWLLASGALRSGHFRLSSGRHSPAYVQCALLLELPARAVQIGTMLADRLRSYQVDSVLSPAIGGLIIGHQVASALEVPFRFVERADSMLQLRRGFELRPAERLCIVEDVVTTGKSTLETAAIATAAGAQVAVVASILDRTGSLEPFEVPFVSLKKLELPTYRPAECPLCAAGQPVVKPGSRPDS